MAGEKAAAKPAATGSSDDNIFGALCYIIGVIVPLFVLFTEKKSNKFLAFHAWQSLIFTVAWVVLVVGFSVVTMVLTFATGGIAGLLNCLLFPIAGLVFLYVLLVAYKAYQGEKYKMPIVGDFAEKQAMK
ncbi:DUF4870 domain-containing protein [Candidatus Micrarchaeota archaeon]|nr:DUF4870 domain-containing protein [Candidatus Micrarchaeota archaeon]